jgi:uncharacterized protein
MSYPSQPWRDALIARMRIEALPPEKFSHQARLYRLCLAIAGNQTLNDDVLFGACWVHDLGVFIGHRPEDTEQLKRWNSTAYTLNKAPEVLLSCGFPEEKIPAVVECIRTHEAAGEPTTTEGVIFRDADLLELLGSVAVMRTVAKVAQDTRFITFADAAASLRKALEAVPPQIRTEHAKTMAGPRVASLRAFLDALDTESGGLLGFEAS